MLSIADIWYINADEEPIVFLDKRTSNIVYPVFAEALELERKTENWSFLHVGSIAWSSDFFDYCYEEYGRAIDIPKLDFSYNLDDIFMRYDNMSEWMRDKNYI